MGEGDKKANVWQTILDDVASHTKTRQLKSKNVLLLGDEGTGKSTLITRIQGRKHDDRDSAQGTGLEYTYVNVKDQDNDDVIGRLGVYTLDGNEEHKQLLQFVLTKETLPDTVVVINLDMSRTWTLMESATRWIAVLEEHIESLGKFDEMDGYRKNQVRYFQSAMHKTGASSDAESGEDEGEDEDGDGDGDEDEDGADGNNAAQVVDEEQLLDLEAGTLEVNLGIPIIFVVSKCDCVPSLQRDRDYRNEHFDFIQLNLRTLALKYGASVVYTSKDGKTQDKLYKYMLHRAYGLPFTSTADVSGNDNVFVPTGWDNQTHMSVLHDGFKTIKATDSFEQHIKAPSTANTGDEESIFAEDEQEFLKKHQHSVESGNSSKSIIITEPGKKVTKPPASTDAKKTSTGGGGDSTTGGGAGGDASTDVLANFFTSLLKKKPST